MHSNGWIQLALFIGGLALITANTDQAAFGLLGIDGVNDLALDVLAKEEVP